MSGTRATIIWNPYMYVEFVYVSGISTFQVFYLFLVSLLKKFLSEYIFFSSKCLKYFGATSSLV